MSKQKLLFIASGPLISEQGIINQTAFGLRTWQFLSVIKNYEGLVRVILLDEPRFYESFPTENTVRKVTVFGRDIEVIHVQKNKKGFWKNLKKFANSFKPNVLVGVNLMPCFFASKLNLKVPFWADLNGWAMAEAQSQAFVEKNNAYIPAIWQRERAVVQTADVMSTVSDPQRCAVFGQLASLGRLRYETENHSFVYTIQNANETLCLEKPDTNRKRFDIYTRVPKTAKIVFFSGAYNTWLDEKNLFAGLEKAMQQDENLYFVSTGSGIKGFSNKVFSSFKTRIEKSKFVHRFVFLGWLDRADLIYCYGQVDMAINLDRNNAEGFFGARNRINEWLMYGVPVLSTAVSQITKELAEKNLITEVQVEDADDLCRKILDFECEKGKKMALEAKKFAEVDYSYQKTMEPLRLFLQNPVTAPDKNQRLSMNDSFIKRGVFKLKQVGVRGVFDLVRKKWF
ncbi:hypothetical protein CSB37_00075 [bacterium DOLZORAL124_38_8]|nr:MAG: hypothetical protein CSB37_00075 [bacterium DOLZORAL124_38_8]